MRGDEPRRVKVKLTGSSNMYVVKVSKTHEHEHKAANENRHNLYGIEISTPSPSLPSLPTYALHKLTLTQNLQPIIAHLRPQRLDFRAER
jgi:hypothetical protein